MKPAQLEFVPVPPDLRPFIRRHVLADMEDPGVAQWVPGWSLNILVTQFGSPLFANIGGREERVAHVSANGGVTRPYSFRACGGRIRFLVTEFTERGAFCLTGTPQTALRDRSVPFEDVLSLRGGVSLSERLFESRTFEEQVAHINEFFRQLLPTDVLLRHSDPIVDATRLIREGRGTLPIEHLAQKVGLRPSWFRERFSAVVGLSPKQYSELIRFQHAFNAVMDHGASGATMAAELGFVDQPHFIRTFKRYTGFTPSNLPRELFAFARMFTDVGEAG